MRPYRAGTALLVTILLWAVAFPAVRVGVREFDPASLALLRLGIASAVLAMVAPLLGVRRPAVRDLPLFGLAAVTGIVGYQLLLNWGQEHVQAGTASLIVVTNSVYSAILAVAFLGERMTARQVVGAGIALLGVAFIAGSHGGLGFESSAWVVVAAAVAFGSYHVSIKPLLRRYTGFEVAAYATWIGTALLLPAVPVLVQSLPEASGGGLMAAAFLGVAPSALGYVTWGYAIARLPVTVATSALYLVPPTAVLVGFVWLGETLQVVELVGGVVAIGGVALANSRRVPATAPSPHRPAHVSSAES